MWLSLMEDQQAVRSIYGESIPELSNVYVHEVKIINGMDIQCHIRFDLNTLPKILPEKWIERKVNKVQLDISLTAAEIIAFDMSGGDLIGNINIQLEGDGKKLVYRIDDRDVFIIKSKWIYLRTVTGYFAG